MISRVDLETLGYIVAIIFGKQYARNKKVFEDKDITREDTIAKALETIRENSDVGISHNNNQVHNQIHKQPQMNRRERPHIGFYKANSDANLMDDGRWGVGAVIRDKDEG